MEETDSIVQSTARYASDPRLNTNPTTYKHAIIAKGHKLPALLPPTLVTRRKVLSPPPHSSTSQLSHVHLPHNSINTNLHHRISTNLHHTHS